MEPERDPERGEVYERIPWETLEEKKNDRQWLMYGVAGAVVLGALAYSFMSNRPLPVAPTTTIEAAPISAVPATEPAPAPALPPTASTSPVVTAEADLYAVHPERVVDRVSAHAEWFAAEYFTVDGSEESRTVLAGLMPAGVPLPSAGEGARVFVESVRASNVEEVGPATYRVTVLSRSLAAASDGLYTRQPPLELVVDVAMSDSNPQVLAPPLIRPAPIGPAHQLALAEVPEPVAAAALEQAGGTDVLGGTQTSDGGWQVFLLVVTDDGVSRPVTVEMPP